jgi:hypothetical protein
MSMRGRWVLSIALLAIIGILTGPTVTIKIDNEPEWPSMALANNLSPRPGDASAVGGASGTNRWRKYEIAAYNNRTDAPMRYQIVEEFFDERGDLLRRHIVGPVVVLPGRQVRKRDQLRLSWLEARRIATMSHRIESLDP